VFDSPALDVAIGLALVFFLFALAVSKINEIIASVLGLRHKGLEKALAALLGSTQDAGTGDAAAPRLSVEAVLTHPLVAQMHKAAENTKGKRRRARFRLPAKGLSYLPSRTFSAAVLDLLAPPCSLDAHDVLMGISTDGLPPAVETARIAALADPTLTTVRALAAALPPSDQLDKVKQLIDQLGNDSIRQAANAISGLPESARTPLLRMLADAKGDRDRFRRSLEHWYDDTMDRVSGWYKRYVQRIIVIASVVLVVALNVDTINIAQVLWRLPTERAVVASAAAAQATAGDKGGQSADQRVRDIAALELPLGWTPQHNGAVESSDPRHAPLGLRSWLLKILGLLLSVLAIALGAPFWFDALSKLGELRQTGPKPAKSGAPAS
jgi:hypothetical protein